MIERAKKSVSLLFLLLLFPNLLLLFGMGQSGLSKQASADAMVEEDVVNALAGLLSEDTPLEAAKAQAVLLRTDQRKNADTGIDTDMEKSESYSQTILALARQAVYETSGVVLTYEGEYIDAIYHAVSSSMTRDADGLLGEEYAYLVSVDSRWDILSEDYLSVTYVQPQELLKQIGISEYDWSAKQFVKKVKIKKRDEAGYVERVSIADQEFEGERLREAWGLSSSCFYLSAKDDQVRILTKGVGHGLGLSLYGACQMAQDGASYEEILQHYFPKVTIGME
jgi:stage II sporulation protein D